MKVQVLTKQQESLEGYELVYVSEDGLDLSHISDNECEFILAPDVLDNFPSEKSSQVLAALLSKLRMNGELVVGGTDLVLFCMAVVSGNMPKESAGKLVGNLKSMTCCTTIHSELKSLGVKVLSMNYDGIHYELKVGRN